MMQRARVSKKSMVSRVQFVFTAEAQQCMSLGERLNLGGHYLLFKSKVPRRWAGILPHAKFGLMRVSLPAENKNENSKQVPFLAAQNSYFGGDN